MMLICYFTMQCCKAMPPPNLRHLQTFNYPLEMVLNFYFYQSKKNPLNENFSQP